jgi:hypothetical protein
MGSPFQDKMLSAPSGQSVTDGQPSPTTTDDPGLDPKHHTSSPRAMAVGL